MISDDPAMQDSPSDALSRGEVHVRQEHCLQKNNRTGLQDVYYDGDSVDWNKIEIGSYNDALKNASIHYFCATEIRKVTADEETVTAEINCQRDRTDAAAWCAFYRKNGQMIQAETAPLNAAQRNRVTFTVPEGTDTIQWFAVDSGRKPLCESMTVR